MFKKTYMSAAMSRAFAVDYPVGDPFGGPAYGERLKSGKSLLKVVGIAAAVFTAGTSLMALAAAEVVSIGMIVQAVGAGLAVVGAVTGNTTLAMIGGITSVIGGVVSAASSSAATATSAAGTAGIEGATQAATSAAVETSFGAGAGEAMTSSIANETGILGNSANAIQNTASLGSSPLSQGILGATPQMSAAGPSMIDTLAPAAPVNPISTGAEIAPPDPVAAASAPANTAAVSADTVATPGAQGAAVQTPTSNGYFKAIQDIFGTNKAGQSTTMGIPTGELMKVGGNMLAGSSDAKAKEALLQKQLDEQNKRLAQQRADGSAAGVLYAGRYA